MIVIIYDEYIEEQGGIAIIPGRKNSKKEVFYLKEVEKKRYVVENYFGRMKRYRRLGTRYDRLSSVYLSFLSIASLMDWVK